MQTKRIEIQIGNRVRELRSERGLSQDGLARQAGLHRAYLGQIERGEKIIGIRNLEKIARALRVQIPLLFQK